MNWGVIKEAEIPVAILSLSLIPLPALYLHMVGEGISRGLKKKKDGARVIKCVNTSLLIYSILCLPCHAVKLWTRNLEIENVLKEKKFTMYIL